jgi:hypothetical protein
MVAAKTIGFFFCLPLKCCHVIYCTVRNKNKNTRSTTRERERENLWNTFGSPERKRTIAGDGSRLGHGRPSHWVTRDPRLGLAVSHGFESPSPASFEAKSSNSFLMPQKLILMSQKWFLMPQFNFGLKTKTYREKLTLVGVLSS